MITNTTTTSTTTTPSSSSSDTSLSYDNYENNSIIIIKELQNENDLLKQEISKLKSLLLATPSKTTTTTTTIITSSSSLREQQQQQQQQRPNNDNDNDDDVVVVDTNNDKDETEQTETEKNVVLEQQQQQQQPQQLLSIVDDNNNDEVEIHTNYHQNSHTHSHNNHNNTNKNIHSNHSNHYHQQRLTNNEIERYSRQILVDDYRMINGSIGQEYILRNYNKHSTTMNNTTTNNNNTNDIEISVLVIGAGGIGSTVLLYLACSGIQKIGIMDHDTVDISNLHRQIIHNMKNIGYNKAISAQQTIYTINPNIQDCRAIPEQLTTYNAIQYISQYTIIIDATDNPKTRYIINDTCILLNNKKHNHTNNYHPKIYIFGSAVGTQGQFTVYNFPVSNNHNNTNNNTNNNNTDSNTTTSSSSTSTNTTKIVGNNNSSCCYRCMYPDPTLLYKNCMSCTDAGVIGPVPGLIGILQAIEALKIITLLINRTLYNNNNNTNNNNNNIDNMNDDSHIMYNRLLMYDAISCTFYSIQKPKRNLNCIVCGTNPTICNMDDCYNNLYNTTTSTSCTINDTSTIPSSMNEYNHNISCIEYYTNIYEQAIPHILLDVRVQIQYDLCSLINSIHIPLDDILSYANNCMDDDSKNNNENSDISNNQNHKKLTELLFTQNIPIYCICRRGIASKEAVRVLQNILYNKKKNTNNANAMNTTNTTNTDITTSSNINDNDNNNNNEIEQQSSSISSKIPRIYNIIGGLVAWQEQVDSTFPKY